MGAISDVAGRTGHPDAGARRYFRTPDPSEQWRVYETAARAKEAPASRKSTPPPPPLADVIGRLSLSTRAEKLFVWPIETGASGAVSERT